MCIRDRCAFKRVGPSRAIHRCRSTAVRSQCNFIAVRFSSSVNILATIWPLIEIVRSLVLTLMGSRLISSARRSQRTLRPFCPRPNTLAIKRFIVRVVLFFCDRVYTPALSRCRKALAIAEDFYYLLNKWAAVISVSYTHLTLPTKRIV